MLTRLMAVMTIFCAAMQSAFAMSIDEQIDKYFAPFSDAFSNVVFL